MGQAPEEAMPSLDAMNLCQLRQAGTGSRCQGGRTEAGRVLFGHGEYGPGGGLGPGGS